MNEYHDAESVEVAASMLDLLTRRPAWHKLAACRGSDPNLFFPERGEDVWHAQRVCERCPVRSNCLQQALDDNERAGVWGGVAGKERRRLRRMGGDGAAA